MKYLLFFLFVVITTSCQEEEKKLVCGNRDIEMCDTITVNDPKISNGKALFKANCASCHTASTKRTVGPGLCGVYDRIPAGDWKYEFIRNADSVIKSGDAYANALFIEYSKTQHTRFPNLSNEEIDAILAYCSPSHCY